MALLQFDSTGGTPGNVVTTSDAYPDAPTTVIGTVTYTADGYTDTGFTIPDETSSNGLEWDRGSGAATATHSVGFWFYPAALPTEYTRLSRIGASNTISGLVVSQNGTGVMELLTGTTPEGQMDLTIPSAGEWYWVTYWIDLGTDEAELALYDSAGTLIDSVYKNNPGFPGSSAYSLQIGRVANNGSFGAARFDTVRWDDTTAALISPVIPSPGGPTGTGAITATAVLAGSGTAAFAGTGAVTASTVLAGSGGTARAGTGAVTASAVLAGSGSGLEFHSGTGAITATSSLAGSGFAAMSGTGAVTAASALSGTGGSGETPRGTGSITAVAGLAAAGVRRASGSGQVSVGAALAAGGATARSGVGDVAGLAVLYGNGRALGSGQGAIAAAAVLDGSGWSSRVGVGAVAAVGHLAGFGYIPGIGLGVSVWDGTVEVRSAVSVWDGAAEVDGVVSVLL